MLPMLRVRAYAKLNLFLRVVGKRADGFHEIESVFHGIGLGDYLKLELAERGVLEVRLHAPEHARERLPRPGQDLVARAARLLQLEQRPSAGARITVFKRIPIGAGLGGGSADAAATLAALDRLWGLHMTSEALAELGAALGSDVPYFLHGGTAVVTGRGERVVPVHGLWPRWFLVGVTGPPLPTGDVYSAWDDERDSTPDADPSSVIDALRGSDLERLATALHNDLEPAAFRLRPELRDKKRALLDAGAPGACLSGSGAALFAPVADADAGARLADAVAPDFDVTFVVASRPVSLEVLT